MAKNTLRWVNFNLTLNLLVILYFENVRLRNFLKRPGCRKDWIAGGCSWHDFKREEI